MKLLKRIARLLSVGAAARSRSQRAKQAPLRVEQLDERLVPAVTFASYATGTWAFNSSNHGWREITPARARVMTEGADGTLFVSYDSGTWRYDYGTNVWKSLTTARASTMSAATDNTLFASYGNGTFAYDGTGWHLETSRIASKLAGVSDRFFYGSFSDGTWEYGGLSGSGGAKIYGATTGVMGADAGGNLFASYSTGTYWYNGGNYSPGWHLLTGNVASAITVDSDDGDYTSWGQYGGTFIASYSSGTWEYNLGSWTKMSNATATQLSSYRDNLFLGGFGNGTFWGNVDSYWYTAATGAPDLMA